MYVPAHRLSGMLSMIAMNHVLSMIVMKHVLGMIVMKHVLGMIVMNHVHVFSCFHRLSGMLCAILTINACYDCRT